MSTDSAEPPASLRTVDFDYELPLELIAQTPIEPRDKARLMALDRRTGEITHHRFDAIGSFLRPGDLLVLNDSRVIPARLRGHKAESGGAVEFLLLHPMGNRHWQALARPARRLRAGTRIVFQGGDRSYEAQVLERSDAGVFTISLDDEDAIEACGEMPLPPYIHEALKDPERYQTVYAKERGSAAAPTAGLHFTAPLLERLSAEGVRRATVTLHIGLDTFRPVEAEDPRRHHIHREYAQLSEETAHAINETREKGGRIVAVGTTTTRILETAARGAKDGVVAPYAGWTDLMMLPGHVFQAVDVLITNFHLPRSTLLMLVSAFAGKPLTDRAYALAVKERYRFYSFGDAMVIV